MWVVPVEGCVDEYKVVEEFCALLQAASGSMLQWYTKLHRVTPQKICK